MLMIVVLISKVISDERNGKKMKKRDKDMDMDRRIRRRKKTTLYNSCRCSNIVIFNNLNINCQRT